MNFLKKSVGFLAVLGVVPAAFALTARPSVVGTASTRLPTMTAYLNSYVTSSGSTTSNLLDNAECIEAYTACLKDANVCGTNFEECTTKVLFHGKMPQCLSTLAQCSASGVNALFGTSSTTALSNVASKNTYGEITDYTYPTDGSVLGQMIAGAAISNMYNTSDCVRRYTTCLQRDNVCGSDFELCTTSNEFKKQMVYCDSTLARCQSEGKIELFGSTNTSVAPSSTSRIGVMITEGAALAAVNAVSTCYKVVDQCILNACSTNPYKCYENSSAVTISLVDAIKNGTLLEATSLVDNFDTNSSSSVQSYVKNSCLNTIGANKYCYATFLGNGAMPSSSQLSDADNQEMVFSDAYAARMNSSMKAKITELIEEFDTEAKSNCVDTIKTCAMRVCGGGSGAACYSQVFGATDKTINNSVTYEEIKTGCSDIVNTDPYCKYAATNPDNVGSYTYSYIDNNAFDTLFPKYSNNSGDPIGVIASLNASLATSYSDAAIAQMRTQCENVAKSCVRSMCGTDYTGCYRNRTDIYSTLTSSGNSIYDKSMNKVGGVLDYTVVLGLCLDTVKNASVCKEHLAIEQNKLKISDNSASSWGAGTSSVRDGWIDAGAATQVEGQDGVQATDANGNLLCTASDGSQGSCNTVDSTGKVYDTPVYISYESYLQNEAATTLFRELVYDLEKEAQAIYNKKLTEEQNMCLAANAGGIMGSNDTGSTYMWVKLKSKNVPNDYAIKGLNRSEFNPSNELYGSFCSVQVRLQSDDAKLQAAMKGADWATAYFAVGDAFTCGSWIPEETLSTLAKAVASEATEDTREAYKRTEFWTTLLGTVGGTVGGWFLGDSIREGKTMGSLTGLTGNTTEDVSNAKKLSIKYIDYINTLIDDNNVETKVVDANLKVLNTYAKKLDIVDATIKSVNDSVDKWKNAKLALNSAKSEEQNQKQKELDSAKDAVKKSLELLKMECEAASTVSNSNKKTAWITPVTAGVLGIAGGFLLNKATRDIQEANLSAAEKAAYEEWMNNVGKHLKCYIGTDEAGQYGDILSVSME